MFTESHFNLIRYLLVFIHFTDIWHFRSVNKLVWKICQDPHFWTEKIQRDFPNHVSFNQSIYQMYQQCCERVSFRPLYFSTDQTVLIRHFDISKDDFWLDTAMIPNLNLSPSFGIFLSRNKVFIQTFPHPLFPGPLSQKRFSLEKGSQIRDRMILSQGGQIHKIQEPSRGEYILGQDLTLTYGLNFVQKFSDYFGIGMGGEIFLLTRDQPRYLLSFPGAREVVSLSEDPERMDSLLILQKDRSVFFYSLEERFVIDGLTNIQQMVRSPPSDSNLAYLLDLDFQVFVLHINRSWSSISIPRYVGPIQKLLSGNSLAMLNADHVVYQTEKWFENERIFLPDTRFVGSHFQGLDNFGTGIGSTPLPYIEFSLKYRQNKISDIRILTQNNLGNSLLRVWTDTHQSFLVWAFLLSKKVFPPSHYQGWLDYTSENSDQVKDLLERSICTKLLNVYPSGKGLLLVVTQQNQKISSYHLLGKLNLDENRKLYPHEGIWDKDVNFNYRVS